MNSVVVAFALLIWILVTPSYVFADRCDDVMDYANKIYDTAVVAAQHDSYTDAAKLFESARSYYVKASKMKKCRCPKIEGAAKIRAKRCKSYAAQYRKASKPSESIAYQSARQEEYADTECGNKSLVSITLSDGSVEEYCE
jgi:hypothetical protein